MNLARTPLARTAQLYRIAHDLSASLVPLFSWRVMSCEELWERLGKHLVEADARELRRLGQHFMVLARVRSAVDTDEASESRPAE